MTSYEILTNTMKRESPTKRVSKAPGSAQRHRPARNAPVPTGGCQADVWRFGLLAALGAWTIVVPYLGRAIGLLVDVASKIEIVDHVVPGTVVAVIGTYLAVNAQHNTLPKLALPIGGSICFLAGFWVLATHVPLIADAVNGKAPWGSTIWHASTALPLVALSLWAVLKDL